MRKMNAWFIVIISIIAFLYSGYAFIGALAETPSTGIGGGMGQGVAVLMGLGLMIFSLLFGNIGRNLLKQIKSAPNQKSSAFEIITVILLVLTAISIAYFYASGK